MKRSGQKVAPVQLILTTHREDFSFVNDSKVIAKSSKVEKREDKIRQQQQNQMKLHPPFTVKLCFVFLALFSSHDHQSVSFFWFSGGFVPRSSLRS